MLQRPAVPTQPTLHKWQGVQPVHRPARPHARSSLRPPASSSSNTSSSSSSSSSSSPGKAVWQRAGQLSVLASLGSHGGGLGGSGGGSGGGGGGGGGPFFSSGGPPATPNLLADLSLADSSAGDVVEEVILLDISGTATATTALPHTRTHAHTHAPPTPPTRTHTFIHTHVPPHPAQHASKSSSSPPPRRHEVWRLRGPRQATAGGST